MDDGKLRTRTTISLEPAVHAAIEVYMTRTDRTFSGAVNWLCKRQLTLIENDPGQDIAS